MAKLDVVLHGMAEDEKTCLSLNLSIEGLSSFGSSLLPYTALTRLNAKGNHLTSVAGKALQRGQLRYWMYNTSFSSECPTGIIPSMTLSSLIILSFSYRDRLPLHRVIAESGTFLKVSELVMQGWQS